MFTGIIDHCGRIIKKTVIDHGIQFTISTTFNDLISGESICVNGICLTVTSFSEQAFCCDLSPETLALTTASQWNEEISLNLERALRPQDRLGGHFVMGHVDHVGKVMDVVQQGKFLQVIIGEILPETRRYLIHKGSITLNGVSLTINAVHEKKFEVMLIPETLARTNLAYLKKDDTLNIEYDILAKMVAQNAGNFSYEHFVETKNV